MKNNIKYFECSCSDELLRVEYEPSVKEPETIRFAIYESGISHQNFETKSSLWDFQILWQRIKYCWNHLWTGHIHTDSMLLDSTTAKELGEFLTESAIDKIQQTEYWLDIKKKIDKAKKGELIDLEMNPSIPVEDIINFRENI